YREYAKDPRMRLNLGIRRRLAPLMDNGRRQIELMHSLLLTLPGSPVLYYGDEIGMGDNIYLGDRNGVRTPMQWSGDRNAGFSRADPSQLYPPLILDPVYHVQAISVEPQVRSQTSLLHWLRGLIRVRKKYPVFGWGTLRFVPCENHRVVAYLREYDGQTVLVVNNLSRFAQPAALDVRDYRGRIPVELLGNHAFPPITEQPYFLSLSPYAFFWFRLDQAGEAASGVPLEVGGGASGR